MIENKTTAPAAMTGNAIRETLEPFAKEAEGWSEATPDCFEFRSANFLTVGDLRRARTAYDAIGSGVKAETAACFIQRSTLAELRKDKTATTTVCSPLLKQPFGDPVALYTKEAFQLSTHTAANARPSDDRLWDQTLTERDNYHDAADKLAEAIGELLGVEVGEHSSAHSPWESALEHAGQAVRNREISTHTAAGAGPVGEAVAAAHLNIGYLYGIADSLQATNPTRAGDIRQCATAIVVGLLAHPAKEPGKAKAWITENDMKRLAQSKKPLQLNVFPRDPSDISGTPYVALAAASVCPDCLDEGWTLTEGPDDRIVECPRCAARARAALAGDAQEGGR